MTDISEREAFEAWVRGLPEQMQRDLTLYDAETYKNSLVRNRWIGWQARALLAGSADKALMEQALAALKDAAQFISNGVECGYIRMPNPDYPDPALKTPSVIDTAIAALRERLSAAPAQADR